MIISSRTDIDTYVSNVHPDCEEHGLETELADAIQDADHPSYGTDWEEWLDANIDELRAEASSMVPY